MIVVQPAGGSGSGARAPSASTAAVGRVKLVCPAQAGGSDGHFAIEQGARAWNGLFVNFNGTAGVWRARAIREAGGWQGDTITEDLDLSYRAQLAGWRIGYTMAVTCPAEIPETVEALQAQQRRWARGSLQTARKLLPKIWRAPGPVGRKLAATFHLTHYTVAIWMTLLAVLALPVLLEVPLPRASGWLWAAWAVVFASAASPCLSYGVAGRVLGRPGFALRNLPGLVALGSGLSLNNALAALAGLAGRPSSFDRTPKSGGRAGRYRAARSRTWWAELGLGFYSIGALVAYASAGKWVIGTFLVFYAAGFLALGWSSRPRGDARGGTGSGRRTAARNRPPAMATEGKV